MSKKLELYEEAKLQNESQWPKVYTRKFLEQGLVDYNDSGYGTLLLSKQTIDGLIPSFIGKPVIIRHFEVTPENFIDFSVGYITNIYFNPTDGWYYVDFLVTHDEGHKKMDDGWGVSCFYTSNKKSIDGKYHNIPYDGEIVGGAGEHLALVPNPRYEECLEDVSAMAAMNVDRKPAYLYNATNYLIKHKQSTEDTAMVKIIGKKSDKGFSVDALIECANGVKMKIKDLIALANGAQDVHEVEETTEIDLGNGKSAKLGDLVKLANKATDEGEESDEDKNKKKAEAEEANLKNATAAKFKNCGCGGEEKGKHMEDCKMYNDDGSEKEEKEEDKMKAANAVRMAELEEENKALKEGAANLQKFVEIRNSKGKSGNEEALLLENGTTESGSMEAGFNRAKAYFGTKQ